MADSPTSNKNSGVVTFTVKADGKAINSQISIIAINVFYTVNQIATAELEISDGNMATQKFAASESNTFTPGATIQIKVGYASKENVIYEGIIISHAIRITGNNRSILHITCKDKAIGMTIARKSKGYLKQSDSDIIQSLISDCSGIKVEEVKTISEKHDELVQFNCTDWDFLLTRAEANGFIVANQQNALTVAPPTVDGAAELVVTYGIDLINFAAEIDVRNQFTQVSGAGWDPAEQKMLKGQAAAESIADQGNLSANSLASVLGIKNYRMQTSASLTEGMLNNWVKGQRVKSMLSKTRGSVTFNGSAKAKINSLIKLDGLGERFNGSHYIGGVHHQIANGQWLTTVELGLSPIWSSEHRDLGAPPAAGWLPPADGLQIGIVTKLDADPQSQFRIQVKIPALGDEDNLVWARLASYYANNETGNFFIPELNSEVVVGYINQDPSQPIILGCLYSSKQAMPYKLTAKNNTKALITKSKLTIEFDDEGKVITITTPGKNSITLSDDDKSIKLVDENKNSITLNNSGISLTTNKDITLAAKGEISLSSTSNTAIQAKADVKIQGLNISTEAKIGLTAKGSTSAEFSASGLTTVKGGMVKIN